MEPTTNTLSAPTVSREVEVMWYDDEFRRLHRLEVVGVPREGEVHEGYKVTRVRESKQTFCGRPIVFVYVRKV